MKEKSWRAKSWKAIPIQRIYVNWIKHKKTDKKKNEKVESNSNLAPSTRTESKAYRLESLYLVIRLRSFQLGEPLRRGIDGDRLLLERGAEAFEGVDDEEEE